MTTDAVQTMIPTLDISESPAPRAKVEAGVKLRGAEKVARIPVKIIPTTELPKKPDWIRVRIPVSPEVDRIKALLRKHKLHSVCEEASCPNLTSVPVVARSATSATAGRSHWTSTNRKAWPSPSPT